MAILNSFLYVYQRLIKFKHSHFWNTWTIDRRWAVKSTFRMPLEAVVWHPLLVVELPGKKLWTLGDGIAEIGESLRKWPKKIFKSQWLIIIR